MNDFDQAARYAVKLDPAGFFRWLWPDIPSPLVFRRWRDTRTLPFPGEPDRICDTVAEFEDLSEPARSFMAVVEFQARPESDMLLRLLEYLARLLRERGRAADNPIVAALLNLTGPVQASTLTIELPGRPEVGLRLGVELRTMREEDAAAALAGIAGGRIARGMLPWVPLMRGAAETDIIEEWQRVAAMVPDNRLRIQYGSLSLFFADLAGRQAAWRAVLEDWEMYESEVANTWRAQGALRRARTDLIQVLEARFPGQLPPDLLNAVNTQTDLDEISRWLVTAATAGSMAAFQKAVQQTSLHS